MKECKICGKFPVLTGDGFCLNHHKIWTQKKRELKNNFIEFMILKEKYNKENGFNDLVRGIQYDNKQSDNRK